MRHVMGAFICQRNLYSSFSNFERASVQSGRKFSNHKYCCTKMTPLCRLSLIAVACAGPHDYYKSDGDGMYISMGVT